MTTCTLTLAPKGPKRNPFAVSSSVGEEGASPLGRRFNPRGVAALYTSFDFETCARELLFGLNTEQYTFYHLAVESSAIADLSSRKVREKLGIRWPELECPTWESEMNRGVIPTTHAVATRLIERGYRGVVVPSFAPGATRDDLNLVLWAWKAAADQQGGAGDCAWVSVLSPEALPKDRSSWDK